jgi:LL-diaminopimelate aminotransferase
VKATNKTNNLPIYIFSELEKVKKELIKKGIEVIDLSIGDPDMDTPEFIVEGMVDALLDKKNYNYPPYRGTDEFKKAVAEYYLINFGVELDYESEVAALIGSKEGIAHLILGMTDIGDYIILPDPSYPVYNASAVISGCKVHRINILEEDNYLPRLHGIENEIIEKSKMLIVNYPNNPTGAVANSDFYKELIEFGKHNNIVIANDGAYMDICSSGARPISLLMTEGAKDICVEFGTLSKSYNMTGWRIGFVVGNKEIINQLMLVKTNFDSGQFTAIQQAGSLALKNGKDIIDNLNELYEERRKILVNALKSIGIMVYDSLGTFYVWFKCPSNYSSFDITNIFLNEIGVLITPGAAFGNNGEGYCRISLTVNNDKLIEVSKRILSLQLV